MLFSYLVVAAEWYGMCEPSSNVYDHNEVVYNRYINGSETPMPASLRSGIVRGFIVWVQL
jgi:hypothetical protein